MDGTDNKCVQNCCGKHLRKENHLLLYYKYIMLYYIISIKSNLKEVAKEVVGFS